MKCSRCGRQLQQAEVREYYGQAFCEDCYMDVLNPPKGCDPWAVRSVQMSLKGKDKFAVLTHLQKRVVQFIEEMGKATAEEIAMAVGVSQPELLREFATLRHMEILRGFRKEGKIFYTLFEQREETQ